MNQVDWSRDYSRRAYERLTVYLPRGRRDQVKAVLREMGMTPNAWINEQLRLLCGVAPDDWKLPLPVEDDTHNAQ